jgi:exodeoxyribonuclease V beta subunit
MKTESALGYRFLEASAGTGKTYTIEQFVLKWVIEGIPLNEILVVTFTKAATKELHERIYQRLQLEREKSKKIDEALACFGEARITTIHGFCKAMLSKFFLEAKCRLNLAQEEETWKVWL